MSEITQDSREYTVNVFSIQFLITLLMEANVEGYIHVLNTA